MARVKSVEVNDLGEVTSALLLKGKTNELTTRHVSTLIPLLTYNDTNMTMAPPSCKTTGDSSPLTIPDVHDQGGRTRRAAAVVAKDRISNLYM